MAKSSCYLKEKKEIKIQLWLEKAAVLVIQRFGYLGKRGLLVVKNAFASITIWILDILLAFWYCYLARLVHQRKCSTLWIFGNSLEHRIVRVYQGIGKGVRQEDFPKPSAHLALLKFIPSKRVWTMWLSGWCGPLWPSHKFWYYVYSLCLKKCFPLP